MKILLTYKQERDSLIRAKARNDFISGLEF